MAEDDRLVEYTWLEEKVLGYRYNIKSDTLLIAQSNISPEANTKILSQTSKTYDPLNVAFPVTIRGKNWKLENWKLEVGWDDSLTEEICNEMKKLSKYLEMLSEVSFPRQVLNEKQSYGLHIFCDSSVEAYGFVV